MIIREVKTSDSKQISDLYKYYVTETAISFEYEAPSYKEMKRRIKVIKNKYPFLVCEIDNNIVGYAYLHSFINRRAYDHSAELTIYVKNDCKGQGIGKSLYTEIEKIAKKMNIYNINSCIALNEIDDEYCTKNSYLFHEHLGFKLVGKFHKSGYKFNRWYDMVWMEKIIAEPLNPIDIKYFNKLK